MSLSGALNIGKSALATHQAAIQVTGNNIANAGSADFTRQAASVSPSKDRQFAPGVFIGTGVNLDSVRRQIDEALEARIRGSVSDSESADAAEQWLSRVEAAFNELGEDDLSTRLSTFFAAWSNLANKPQDMGMRQVVLQEGAGVASWLNDLRTQFTNLQRDADARLKALAQDADGLAERIAVLNGKILAAEGGSAGGGQANGLRDQRDAALKQLSQLVDVRTVPQENGVVNVYVGSEPLVMGADNRGLALRQEPVNGVIVSAVVIRVTGGEAPVAGGQIGGLVAARAKIDLVTTDLDALAHNLIFEMNKLHGSGQGLEGFGSVTATNAVDVTNVALNDARTGLAFQPANGSFVVHVRQKATGLVTSTLVQVDLDGQGAETTLDSLRADLAGISGVNATATGGRLRIDAASDAVEISFSQDTSGTLAALGVNSFFTGRDARDIGMNATLRGNPALLAAARNGQPGDNQTARAVAALESQALAGLRGVSLKDGYQAMVNGVAVSASAAKTEAEASRVVKETLFAQRESLSGVSLDEEAINLMRQQRAFQGAARLVAAVDEMMRTILNMV
ncbi:MAG TPA: flagellar hook-associated protein FlgK [Tepidisphaeraceae bacterium]|nr:flagellar hook-associated protein FlgK [Tepidisphaeraceae bacterium]